MESVDPLLDEARHVIDGEMNCHTPEYRAVDLLHRAVTLLLRRHDALSETVGHVERAAYQAGNVASCLANGIVPD
jgi:hypothetical protein